MGHRYFSEKIVEWYIEHKRELPWRSTSDPYKIWLSEIILQQTRVGQGLPYYLRFIERFSDVFQLAAASEEEVLRLWQGLGYYSRARNLHRCAKTVVERHAGIFPVKFSELIELPGIGEYTAAAIASFSSREIVPVLDGNVFRVLARVFGESAEINSPNGKKIFFKLASALMSQSAPDVYNQGIMEFGATWCTPRNPKCDSCPLIDSCFAFKNKMQDILPVKIKSRKPKNRYFYYFVIKKGGSLMMRKRGAGDIWQGLYDFYLVEKTKESTIKNIIKETPFLSSLADLTSPVTTSQVYKHVLTHQTIFSTFTLLDKTTESVLHEAELEYYSYKKISDLPKPALISRFLQDYDFL